MCASYSMKSRDADFEQHASKIFTGIKEIIPEYAEKRAIWELFQNALDITKEKGIIKIYQTERGFKFEHNGRPFNAGNLSGLIKQSTNGKTFGSNENEVGQYGTGFLSTHVYGKQIFLNASVQTDGGKIKLLTNFFIDREANIPEDLIPKIQEQDNLAAKICDEDGNEIAHHLPFTSFEYLASGNSAGYIKNMFNYIPDILPYIFAFNDKLDKVEVYHNYTLSTYLRNSTKVNELDLLVDGEPKPLPFLSDNGKCIKVLLPQSNPAFENVPKLFLYYPLMVTTDIGINFLIHAKEFKPNKERDYLYLNGTNTDLKSDVEINETLLDTAFALIIKEIESNVSLNFLAAIQISFSHGDEPYLQGKKLELVNAVKDLERITIGEDTVALTSISYLDQTILDLEEKVLMDIYDIVSEFYIIPDYDRYIYLCKKVNNWKVADFKIVQFEDILNRITADTDGLYSKVESKDGYKTLIKTISADSDLLNLKVIPNIHSEFRSHKELKRWDTIELPLINVMDAINGGVSANYLHPDFYFLSSIAGYSREDFKDQLNKFNNDKIALLEKNEGELSRVSSVQFYSIIDALTYFIDLNKVTETNKKLAQFLKKVFNAEGTSEIIPSPTNVLNYDSSFKLLSRLYVNIFTVKDSDFVKSSIELLKEFIDILNNASELKKNLLDKLQCYPNQLYLLKSQSSLKIDECKDEKFKTAYFNRTGIEIREDLVLPGFEDYLQHTDTKTGVQLGEDIEKALSPTKIFLPITDEEINTLLPILLDLIDNISKSESSWGLWLPNLNNVKEDILLYRFREGKTRASLFAILSGSEEKINLLGELAKIDDLAALIKAGKEKQKEERRQDRHRDHIKYIGLKIQDLIKNELDTSLDSTIKLVNTSKNEQVANLEEQNGQDFILYRAENPIFYIEVKSRWDIDGKVALSQRQVERCAEKKELYAVITVNVADYKSRNNIVDDDISFVNLFDDIYVNRDLGNEFEKLIKENLQYEAISENTKLIEYRGHIPQSRIKKTGVDFEDFITDLKSIILN